MSPFPPPYVATGRIHRVLELKQRAFAVAGSMLLAMLIAVGNFVAFIVSRLVLDRWHEEGFLA